MTTKLTREQLMAQIAQAAVDNYRAEADRKSLRYELNALYRTYFAAFGRPYPSEPRKRIDPEDDAYAGVLHFTRSAYKRWLDARDLTNKTKRKLRTLIQRLERAL